MTNLAVDELDGCERLDAAAEDDKAAVAALRSSEERQRKYNRSSCFLKIAKMANLGKPETLYSNRYLGLISWR